GGLRGEAVYRAEIGADGVTIGKLSALYQGQFGRIRAVVASAGKYLYITTSNTDGRGDPHAGDDKIIRLNLP
ncbi:MAG: Glucose sorbosone dehydrogenase, partial [Microgenomates group bacterium GW2011_GWA1_Microgenomates_45_10]